MHRRLAALAALCSVIAAGPAAAQDDSDRTIGTPPLGVEVEPHRGVFADVHIGTFFTLNGQASQNATNSVSNAQAYFGLGVGYDLTDALAVGVWAAYGASSGTCFADPGCLSGAESFSVILADAFLNYLVSLSRQLWVGGRVAGGLSLLTPQPKVDPAADPTGMSMGFNVGLLLTAEFHSYLDHFVIGLDIGGHYILAGNVAFPGIAIYPRLKYVF